MRTLSITLEDNNGKKVHYVKKCLLCQSLDSVDDPTELLVSTVFDLVQALDTRIKETAIASNINPDTSDFGKPHMTVRVPAAETVPDEDRWPSDKEVSDELAYAAARAEQARNAEPDYGAGAFDDKKHKLPIRNPLVPKSRRSIVGAIVREYDDETPINFGKYNGTPLQDINAGYFNWLWNMGLKLDKDNPMHRYIKSRMDAFKMEKPDLVWD